MYGPCDHPAFNYRCLPTTPEIWATWRGKVSACPECAKGRHICGSVRMDEVRILDWVKIFIPLIGKPGVISWLPLSLLVCIHPPISPIVSRIRTKFWGNALRVTRFSKAKKCDTILMLSHQHCVTYLFDMRREYWKVERAASGSWKSNQIRCTLKEMVHRRGVPEAQSDHESSAACCTISVLFLEFCKCISYLSPKFFGFWLLQYKFCNYGTIVSELKIVQDNITSSKICVINLVKHGNGRVA